MWDLLLDSWPGIVFVTLVLSHFSCVRLFATLWTVAHQAPCPWTSPGKNTGGGCCTLLQGIFPTQGSASCLLHLLHWQVGSLQLAESNPEYSLEGLMRKFQYFGYLMWRADTLEKTLMLGKIQGRRRGRQRMRWLDGITNFSGHELEQSLGDSEGQGSLVCCSPRGYKESDMT